MKLSVVTVVLGFVSLVSLASAPSFAADPWADAVISYSNVSNPDYAVGEPNDIGAQFTAAGYLALDMGLGEEIPGNSLVTLSLKNPMATPARVYIFFSTSSGNGWSQPKMIQQFIYTYWWDYTITAPSGGPWRYIKIQSSPDVYVDGVTADAPLPVQLQSLSARYTLGTVMLTWSTATEMNNFGFEIQRRATSGWEKIGFVDGHGTVNTPQRYSFIDEHPLAADQIHYRLKQIDRNGAIDYSPIVSVSLAAPQSAKLEQNYPNPFNPSTTISFALAEPQRITLAVYDESGRLVATLLEGDYREGNYTVPFDGAALTTGSYWYRLVTQTQTITKRMRLVK